MNQLEKIQLIQDTFSCGGVHCFHDCYENSFQCPFSYENEDIFYYQTCAIHPDTIEPLAVVVDDMMEV